MRVISTDHSIKLSLLGDERLSEWQLRVDVGVLRLEERLSELVELGSRQRRLALDVV